MAYWWVNQGESYRQERQAGILWAPNRTRNNQSRTHWNNMDLVRPGDRILHFADQHVKAISAATVPAVDTRRPADLPEDLWDPDGRLVRTQYADAYRPVFREEIPEDWRASEPVAGPFQRNLGVKTGYLFPLTDDFGRQFHDTFGSRFEPLADAAGLTPPQASDSAANLLRDLLGSTVTTITGSENRILAVEPDRVLVGTTRSPEGQWVPIDELERALSRLRTEGRLVVAPEEVGYRSAFISAVLLTLPGTHVQGSPPVIAFGSPDPRDDESDLFTGTLSLPTTVEARGEQSRLRRRLFGNADEADCSLCGRTYPTRFLVAAHIKKRTLCTDDERRDLAHVAMPACSFGCDALFEAGYIAVDHDGRVIRTQEELSDDLTAALDALTGRRCTAFTPGSDPYFTWHRQNTFRST